MRMLTSMSLYMRGAVPLFCLVRLSWQSGPLPQTQPAKADGNSREDIILRPVYPGLNPQYQRLAFLASLSNRDCLENGSNYCFGTSNNFCTNCGTYCSGSSRNWCCADATSTCCGSGCCAEGEVCTDGQCASPVVTVTSTTTVFSTVTRFATELASVEFRVDETSIFNSLVVVTISNVDVATEVAYTTTTLVAKRGVPSEMPLSSRHFEQGVTCGSGSAGHLSSIWERLTKRELVGDCDDENISPFAPRIDAVPWDDERFLPNTEANILAARAASTSTSVISVTSLSHTTSTVSSTSTVLTTAIAIITSVQTRTSVINAKETFSITSTITRTYVPPRTETRTATRIIVASPASDTAASSHSQTPNSLLPGPSHSASRSENSSLPNPTIIGIGVGSGIGAIILFGIIFVIWRVRVRSKRRVLANEPHYTPVPTMSTSLPRPRPPPPRKPFTPPPANYGAFTRLPRGAVVVPKSNPARGRLRR